jgi:hypothetical protein
MIIPAKSQFNWLSGFWQQKCSLDGHIQDCVFVADRKSNMAARAYDVFWLVEILKIFLLETTKPIELWLCRNDHWVVNISAKFGSNLFCGFRKKDENVKFP